MTITIRNLIPVAFILIIVILSGWFFLAQPHSGASIKDLLQRYGFHNAAITATDYQKGQLIYHGITLDADHFSTIKAIRIDAGWKERLLGHKPRSIIFDDIKLMADVSQETGLRISGWQPPPHASPVFLFPSYDEITLNGGQIDIDSPAGGLRFQAKGMAQKMDNNTLKIRAALWGIQNQIKMESLWNATLRPDGTWSAEATLENAGLNLDRIQASRVSGWVALDRTAQNIFPTISGQLDSGKITWDQINFMNSRVTFDGSYNLYKIIAKGHIAGFEAMTALIDLENTAQGLQIKASVETNSADDLAAFLKILQNSSKTSGYLTSLLLTPGNIERLQQNIDKTSYDTLELQIYGMPYDLTGKVIASTTKSDIIQKHVISLDPGTP